MTGVEVIEFFLEKNGLKEAYVRKITSLINKRDYFIRMHNAQKDTQPLRCRLFNYYGFQTTGSFFFSHLVTYSRLEQLINKWRYFVRNKVKVNGLDSEIFLKQYRGCRLSNNGAILKYDNQYLNLLLTNFGNNGVLNFEIKENAKKRN